MKKASLVLLALVACSNSPAQTQDPVVSDATPAQTAEADAGSTQTVEVTQKTETTAEGAAPVGAPQQFKLPPPKIDGPAIAAAMAANAPVSKIEGCAQDGKTPSRGGPMSRHEDDKLSVKADGKSITVEHFANHACCQKGVVTTTLGEGTIEVTETLDGKACRCMCSSTFTTVVPVSPGRYSVHVKLVSGTASKDVGTESIEVK